MQVDHMWHHSSMQYFIQQIQVAVRSTRYETELVRFYGRFLEIMCNLRREKLHKTAIEL